VTRARVAQG